MTTNIKKMAGVVNTETELVNSALVSDGNLQGYWRLNSSSTDETANNNDLNNEGSVTWVTGLFGNCANFVSASSQQLVLGDAYQTGLDFTSSFTISAWIYLSSLTATVGILGKDAVGGGGYAFDITSTGQLRLVTRGLAAATTFTAAGVITTGVWIYCLAYFNDATDETRVYVNGINRKTSTNQTGSISGTDVRFVIGAGRDGVSYMDGKIDDVAVFNRVLTDAEILSLYRASIKSASNVAIASVSKVSGVTN